MINNNTTPTVAPVATRTRPYTSYNIFFQLEREYILQIIHGYQPTTNDKLFDPADTSNYQGPPLPTRYANLILPYDWHIPGKTLRRKRSHRKSHGKIGFHELNEQISKSWGLMVDEETRRFCTCLSELEGRKYKKIRKKYKKKTTKKDKKPSMRKCSIKKTPTKQKDNDCKNDVVASFDWAPVDNFDPQEDVAAPKIIGRMISRESFHQDDPPSHRDSITSLSEVDMRDDEIRNLWDSTPIEDEAITTCQMCVEISSEHPPQLQLPRPQEEEKDEEETQVGNDTRMSFIDEEYERFKEIGQQFKTNRRSSSVSSSGVCIPGKLKRKAFMARGA